MMPGGAQDRRRLDHAAGALGENIRIPRLFDSLPQPVGPDAAFGSGRDLGSDEVAEEPHRAVVKDRVGHYGLDSEASPE